MSVYVPPEFSDWQRWPSAEPFEDMAGPFFFKRMEDGTIVSGFKVEEKHLNGGGAIHGGMLMTFADYALFSIAMDALGEGGGVTIALNGEFTAAGRPGGIVLAEGEVVRNTGSMVFVRGTIRQAETTLVSFSGIIRKLRKASA